MKTLIILLFMTFNVMADEYGVYDEKNHHADIPIKGDKGDAGRDGVDGRDGIGIKGDTGISGRDGLNLNDNQITRGIAISGAMSQIPALSHVGKHNHTGAGVGVSSYGNQSAMAIGLLHQETNRSYKATIGLSGSETIIGGGASWAFE